MSVAGKSYEAWKESMMQQAEDAGDEPWNEECGWTASSCLNSLVDMKGAYTGLFLGLGLVLASVVLLLPNFNHLMWGKRTIGMVVGHNDYINRRSNTLVAPIVRYSAPGGVCDFVGCLSVPRRLYPIDKEVSVLYLPSNPKNAVIADFVQMFMIPSIVCGVGLVCLTGTAGIMFFIARGEVAPTTAPAFDYTQQNPALATSAPATAAPQPTESATCEDEDASDESSDSNEQAASSEQAATTTC
jgi:hypothetical protein